MRKLGWVAWAVLPGTFFAAFAVSAALTAGLLVRGVVDVRVPRLTGRSEAEARHLAAQRRLRIEVAGRQVSEDVASGLVLHQSVSEGEAVREGRLIRVYVSAGPRERSAPRVVDLSLAAAGVVLDSSEIAGEIVSHACSDDVPQRVVLAQDPPAGEPLRGSRLKMLASVGPCRSRFVMPELRWRPAAEAVRAFEERGFFVERVLGNERWDLPPGTVVSARPSPGTIVGEGDRISLTFSRTPSDLVKGVDDPPRSEVTDLARWTYIRPRVPPALFRREVKLRVRRELWGSASSFDFRLRPGENAPRVFWMPPGSEAEFEIDGVRIWRRKY